MAGTLQYMPLYTNNSNYSIHEQLKHAKCTIHKLREKLKQQEKKNNELVKNDIFSKFTNKNISLPQKHPKSFSNLSYFLKQDSNKITSNTSNTTSADRYDSAYDDDDDDDDEEDE